MTKKRGWERGNGDEANDGRLEYRGKYKDEGSKEVRKTFIRLKAEDVLRYHIG